MGEITMRVGLNLIGAMFVEGGLCDAGEALALRRGLLEGRKLKAFGLEGTDLVMVYEHDEVEGKVEVSPEFQRVRFEWHRF